MVLNHTCIFECGSTAKTKAVMVKIDDNGEEILEPVCKKHATGAKDRDIKVRLYDNLKCCQSQHCTKNAKYNDEGLEEGKLKFCETHNPCLSEDKMELDYYQQQPGELKKLQCMVKGCCRGSTYHCYLTLDDDTTHLYFICIYHVLGDIFKDKKVIKYDKRICNGIDCSKRACKKDPETKKLLWCEDCNPDAKKYISIINVPCITCKNKTATYGKKGGKVEFCLTCIPEGQKHLYFDLRHKMCEKCNETRPSFAFRGESMTAILCKKCIPKGQEDNYIDVCHYNCNHKNCETSASLITDSLPKIMWCKKHIPDDGNIYYDRFKPKCNNKDCNIIASYGEPGTRKGITCIKHKLYHYIEVLNKKCEPNNGKKCYERAFYAKNGETPKHCKKHQTSNEINVVSPRCIQCKETYVNPKYDIYCATCYYITHPDEPKAKNFGKKEKTVREFIKESFPELYAKDKIRFDRQIHGGSSKIRPDILMKISKGKYINVEIDEYAHKNYSEQDELDRIQLIVYDLKKPKAVFQIRFNPDSYINSLGDKIKSPWSSPTKKVAEIINQKEWDRRLSRLKKKIKKIIILLEEYEVEKDKIYMDYYEMFY